MSDAELDESAELDDGNPSEFGQQSRPLFNHLPKLSVLGGCLVPTTDISRPFARQPNDLDSTSGAAKTLERRQSD